MRKFVALVLVFLSILPVMAYAEEAADESRQDYETAMFAAIEHWDELEKQYDEHLTVQQRFIARYRFTDAIQYAHEDNYAMIDAINACDSLDDFVAILNNGVIDPNTPCVPEDEIIEYVFTIMEAAGYERPELIFALHLNSTHGGHSWHVECGYMGLRTYENGDEFVEPFIEYKLELAGEDHRLTMFADTDIIIDDSTIHVQY